MRGNLQVNWNSTTYGQYAMNEWWFRHVHIRTERHKRNMWVLDQVMDTIVKRTDPFMPPSGVEPEATAQLHTYNKGLMRGCGCNILAG